jgi:hypothetical protein
MSIRKSLFIRVCGEDVEVPINFDLIQRLEARFQRNADVIATVVIPNMATVGYSTIAHAVADILSGVPKCMLSRREICDYVIGLRGEEIATLALQLQTACLYLRNSISEEDFDAFQTKIDTKKPQATIGADG